MKRALRGWVLPALALGLAVAAAVVAGQPNPVGPANGRSVPLRSAAAQADLVPRIVYLSGADVGCYTTQTRSSVHRRLPHRARPVSALALGSGVLVLGSDRTAYLWRDGALARVGRASSAVGSLDGSGAWLAFGGTARRIDELGRAVAAAPHLVVPDDAVLVGAIRGGLIATTGTAVAAGETMLLRRGLPPVVLAQGRALSVASGEVLVGNGDHLTVLNLRSGQDHDLPTLSAVIATGTGTLSPDGRAFAVTARTVDHRRLIVGPVSAEDAHSLRVLPLTREPQQPPIGAGRRPLATPRWVTDRIVLAARTDGRLVEYDSDAEAGWLPRHAPSVVSGLAAGRVGSGARCPMLGQ